MYRMQKLFLLILIISLSSSLFALSQGEQLFKENRPSEAVQVLENEILKGEVSENTYNFLGLAYYQIQDYENSVNSFSRGINSGNGNLNVLYFNQGNAYYALKDYEKASKAFSSSLQSDVNFNPALLNMANSLLMNKDYEEAKESYISYITKCPNDPQKESIEEIIKALTTEMERLLEEQRLIAEANKPKWEQIDDPLMNNDYLLANNEESKENQWEMIDSSLDNLTLPSSDVMLADSSITDNNIEQNDINEEIGIDELIDSSSLNIPGLDESYNLNKDASEVVAMNDSEEDSKDKKSVQNITGDTIINNNYYNYNTYEGGYSNAGNGNDNTSSSGNVSSNVDGNRGISNEYSEGTKQDNNDASNSNLGSSNNKETGRDDISSSNNDNVDSSLLDAQLLEKKRLLSEAEEERRKAQEELDNKLKEHKKLSEEEQQKLNELAELERKI